ncbi:hypothetical protein AGDE_16323 [Angomonas deanei]|uniref:Cation transporter/ATPase, N-terminus, putative n=1 Tax=Angomonas deanei TaxID=59799 RepID=A0A7G2CDS5_9TRYP|nr:hypothetical protein AGDE_16323 [Angomonas deanei]CAD2216843.1 Cation transporter/ATPase, N-terminus, putative [Angomonas deanei]|eukprot:EPY17317.1 hypothetical protein AGDE_16323 [Angomonas deanei]
MSSAKPPNPADVRSEEEFSEREGGAVADTHETAVEMAPAAAFPHPEQNSVFQDTERREASEDTSSRTSSVYEAEPVYNDKKISSGSSAGSRGDDSVFIGNHQGDEPTPESYDPTSKWWSLSLENVFNLVQLDDAGVGLDKEDVPRHGAELGDNVIPVSGGAKWYVILAKQFMNAITVVLLIVIVISAVFKDWLNSGGNGDSHF